MKKRFYLIIAFTFAIVITSCREKSPESILFTQQIENEDITENDEFMEEESPESILFAQQIENEDIMEVENTKKNWWEYDYSELESKLPYILFSNLEINSDFISIQNIMPWIIWDIEPIGNPTRDYNLNEIDTQDMALKVVEIKSDEVTPGMGIPLYIGSEDWENYSFSFEFFMGDNEEIDFAIHNETRLVESNFPDENQFYWFTLNKNGQLAFNTTFGHNWYWIGKIDDIDPNVWNHVELKFINDELNILINEANIGIVNEADINGRGRIALGGGVGSMFKNLIIFAT